jgi:restriction system protein
VERADRAAGGGVDLLAVDARPIRGGRVWVHGAWRAPGDAVDGAAVRALLDAARGEAAGKAVLVTLGRFTAEAREAARDAPVELVDGSELAALVKRHLPQAWATREI